LDGGEGDATLGQLRTHVIRRPKSPSPPIWYGRPSRSVAKVVSSTAPEPPAPTACAAPGPTRVLRRRVGDTLWQIRRHAPRSGHHHRQALRDRQMVRRRQPQHRHDRPRRKETIPWWTLRAFPTFRPHGVMGPPTDGVAGRHLLVVSGQVVLTGHRQMRCAGDSSYPAAAVDACLRRDPADEGWGAWGACSSRRPQARLLGPAAPQVALVPAGPSSGF
jgi:hypothetical protein